MITQERLVQEVEYNPETGAFSRRETRQGAAGGLITNKPVTTGYMAIRIDRKLYYAHRLAFLYMTGAVPHRVDHINHNKTDNRWQNIRGASHIENMHNLSVRATNKSGITGVYWCNTYKKWKAQITVQYKTYALGSFDSIDEAAKARQDALDNHDFHKNHGRKAA